jgi:hypothetical protein
VVDIQVYEHARTDKAILVSEDGEKEAAVWLPLSQVTIHDTGRSFIRDIVLPEWLAKEKGLI